MNYNTVNNKNLYSDQLAIIRYGGFDFFTGT